MASSSSSQFGRRGPNVTQFLAHGTGNAITSPTHHNNTNSGGSNGGAGTGDPLDGVEEDFDFEKDLEKYTNIEFLTELGGEGTFGPGVGGAGGGGGGGGEEKNVGHGHGHGNGHGTGGDEGEAGFIGDFPFATNPFDLPTSPSTMHQPLHGIPGGYPHQAGFHGFPQPLHHHNPHTSPPTPNPSTSTTYPAYPSNGVSTASGGNGTAPPRAIPPTPITSAGGSKNTTIATAPSTSTTTGPSDLGAGLDIGGADDSSARHAAEEDKRRRNTAASARFRVKKKEREKALERSAEDLRRRNQELESEVVQLKNENRWLKELVTRRQDSFDNPKNEGDGNGVEVEEGSEERIAGGVKKGVGTIVGAGGAKEE